MEEIAREVDTKLVKCNYDVNLMINRLCIFNNNGPVFKEDNNSCKLTLEEITAFLRPKSREVFKRVAQEYNLQ